jgi:hypothetical protein
MHSASLHRTSLRIKLKFTPEELVEHSRIAREYQRQSTIVHNTLQKDLTNKIWMQQEALRSLPAHLRVCMFVFYIYSRIHIYAHSHSHTYI